MSMPFVSDFVENPQDFNPTFGPSFYITVIILSLCALLVLVATFWHKLAKKSAIIDAFNLKKNMKIFEYK